MIEVQPDYDMGEFDVLFKDNKMIMQEFVSKLEAKDLGTLKVTGAADAGGVAFEVTGWKPEPKIWKGDKLFGVYKTTPGEDQIFTEQLSLLSLIMPSRHLTTASRVDTSSV